MKITVNVKPSAKEEKIEVLDDGAYKVSVKAPAQGGMANDAVCRALAKHFNVGISRVHVSRGHASRRKIIEII